MLHPRQALQLLPRLKLWLLRTKLWLREELRLRTELWLRTELRLQQRWLRLRLQQRLLRDPSVRSPLRYVPLQQLRLWLLRAELRLREELRLRTELWLQQLRFGLRLWLRSFLLPAG
jgi:hypothetical protein